MIYFDWAWTPPSCFFYFESTPGPSQITRYVICACDSRVSSRVSVVRRGTFLFVPCTYILCVGNQISQKPTFFFPSFTGTNEHCITISGGRVQEPRAGPFLEKLNSSFESSKNTHTTMGRTMREGKSLREGRLDCPKYRENQFSSLLFLTVFLVIVDSNCFFKATRINKINQQ